MNTKKQKKSKNLSYFKLENKKQKNKTKKQTKANKKTNKMCYSKTVTLTPGTQGQVIGANGRVLKAIINRVSQSNPDIVVPWIDTKENPGNLVVYANSCYILDKIVDAIKKREKHIINKNNISMNKEWSHMVNQTNIFQQRREMDIMDNVIENEIQSYFTEIYHDNLRMREYENWIEDCKLWNMQTKYGNEHLDQDAYMEMTIKDVFGTNIKIIV